MSILYTTWHIHTVLDQIMLSSSGISTEMFVLLANCFLHWWKSIIPKWTDKRQIQVSFFESYKFNWIDQKYKFAVRCMLSLVSWYIIHVAEHFNGRCRHITTKKRYTHTARHRQYPFPTLVVRQACKPPPCDDKL